MNSKIVAGLFLGSLLALGGCAADAQDNGDEDTEASEGELSSSAQKLVGAYTGTSSRPPTFEGLVFQQDGHFFADIDTGIRCVRAPCPSSARVEGLYTATAKYVTLKPAMGQAPTTWHGKYGYSLSGKKLALTRKDWSGWSESMTHEISYCAEAKDCNAQSLIHPMCVGAWSCASNACSYKCGVVPVDPGIWPADATQLVAENAGGGFVAPPPAGSTCAVGRAKYTFDVATKKLAWEECSWNDQGKPFHMETGSRTLTAAEIKKIDAAMDGVSIAKEKICGADKPMLNVAVTTPAGKKTYTDAFYSCLGGNRTFVNGIDEVFSAMRDIVH